MKKTPKQQPSSLAQQNKEMSQVLVCLYESLEPANTTETVDIWKRDSDLRYSN